MSKQACIENVIFTSRYCRQDLGIAEPRENFDQNTSEGNLVEIRFCSTGFDGWSDKVGGFQLRLGAGSPINIGCWSSAFWIWDVMPEFVLVESGISGGSLLPIH